ncbi:hypothetical protein SDC9_136696 [bioreactor metagenome]|uniref:Uncharacterized protein n=1 Tax=bioreactor metagenome TaxID=1076179 RepID=A0A645DJF5_9ZZZZ
MEQVFGRKAGQQAVGTAIRGAQVVVKPGMDPRLKVIPAPRGINMGSPSDGQRVHTILVLQQMCGVKAVFAATAGHQTVIAAVVFAVTVAQLAQLLLALVPIDSDFFVFAGDTGVANAVRADMHAFFDAVDRVLKLVAGVGLLIAHDALFAKLHVTRQPIFYVKLVVRDIGCKF